MADVNEGPLYATFARRVRALVLDSVVLVGILFGLILLAASGEFGQTVRLALFTTTIVVAISYEPVLVSFKGRTVGQWLCNLHVVAPTPDGRLPLWKAFVRWLLKGVTGLASFATMGATQRNQALHDLPFGTTVEIANPLKAGAYDYIRERPALVATALPSRARRVAVITLYLIVLVILLGTVLPLVGTPACLDSRRCGPGERLSTQVVATAWLAASIAACILGWQGRLPGARRRGSFAFRHAATSPKGECVDRSQRAFLRDLMLILGLPAVIVASLVAWWKPWKDGPQPYRPPDYWTREAEARDEGLREAQWHGLHLKLPDGYVLLTQDSVIEVLEEEPPDDGPGSWGSHLAFLPLTAEVRQRFERQAENCGLAPGRCWTEPVGTRRLECQQAAGVPVRELRWTPLTICRAEDVGLWLALNAPEPRRPQLWEIARAVLQDGDPVAGGDRDAPAP